MIAKMGERFWVTSAREKNGGRAKPNNVESRGSFLRHCYTPGYQQVHEDS